MRIINMNAKKLAIVTSLGARPGGGAERERGDRRQLLDHPAGHRRQLGRLHQGRARTDGVPGLRGLRRPGHPARRPPGLPRPDGRGLVAGAARGGQADPGADADPALAARLDGGAQRRRRAGRVPLRLVDPGARRRAVEPDLLGGGARGDGQGAGDDRPAGGDAVPHDRARRQRPTGALGLAARAAARFPVSATAASRRPWSATATRACAPTRWSPSGCSSTRAARRRSSRPSRDLVADGAQEGGLGAGRDRGLFIGRPARPLQNAAANDPSPLVRSLAKAALTKLTQ